MKDNDFEELWNSGATARKYRQCHISDQELETIIGNAIERDNKTRKKHFPIWQKPYVYLAMVVACVAAVVVGLWQLRINSVLIPNTPEALQPSPTILVAQTTDTNMPNTQDNKPATITDNEIKNTANQTADRHTHTMLAENSTATLPTADAPQPDATATAPIEQEHIPVLLAEVEIQTHIEQNLVADTAYMIADAGDVYDVLEMYCSTRCSSNEVTSTFSRSMRKTNMI
ncbi:MAG: hypothetical protein IKT84_08260 [Bacteroidales bacterium]|nr:hypothetical protein [Bacteroidales bacterium]